MKLAARLEFHLKKLFLISVGVGTIALFTSIYISTAEIKEKAVSFISSHVKAISSAEINSQNVSEIDREVRRLYEAWRGTQDIDIRVEVYLDEKLVGKAGQLQQFGSMSYSTTRTHALPSGQLLEIKIQLDLKNQILTDLLMLSIFTTFLFGCYYLLRRSLGSIIQQVTNPLEKRIEWLTEVTQSLPGSIHSEISIEESSIEELKILDSSLNVFTSQIKALEGRVKEAGIKEGRVNMAEQLAHTIKGKIALLHLRINNSLSLADNERIKLTDAVSEVAIAAQTLLKAGHLNKQAIQTDHDFKDLNINELLNKVVLQKKETLPRNKSISMELFSEPHDDIIVHGSHTHLESVFANIIDNAIDAININGSIIIKLQLEHDISKIIITDNGCGISESILPQLMQERATFGKIDGNGLGLFHAKKVVKEMKGNIRINSIIGKGTDVILTLPSKTTDFVKKSEQIDIDLSHIQTFVVLDDDPSIHASVNLLLGKNTPFQVVHLYSISDFEDWIKENGLGDFNSRVYWMDYDLKHLSSTGAMMIQKYGLQFESYLVTGMANTEEVIDLANKNNIRLFSKEDIIKVKFIFNEIIRLSEIVLG